LSSSLFKIGPIAKEYPYLTTSAIFSIKAILRVSKRVGTLSIRDTKEELLIVKLVAQNYG
jgi:hypothetical protein